MRDAVQAERGRRLGVLRVVVDEDAALRRLAHMLQQMRIDARIRLHHADPSRHHHVAEARHEIVLVLDVMIGLRRPVGEAIERNARRVQLFKQRHAVVEQSAQGFRPLAVESTDEVGMIRMERDQLRLGFRDRPAAILLQVPGRRADMRQKPAPLLIVRDQLAIQILRAPVEQHAAEIEHHRPDVGHRDFSEIAEPKSGCDASRPLPVRQLRYDSSASSAMSKR